jgi:hypothetical protein
MSDAPESIGHDVPLLFCPFCRECYEGEEVCPDHELVLVAFDALPKRLDIDDLPSDDERLPMYDMRFGRGWLFASAVTGLVGFLLPMVTTATSQDAIVTTGMGVAARVAPNLYVIPAVSVGILSILYRRRTPRAMRGARIVIPALALVGLGSLAYTLYRIREGAAQMSESLQTTVSIEPEVGVWIMALAMAITLLGGLRLGKVARRNDELPHGAGPDGDGGIVMDD